MQISLTHLHTTSPFSLKSKEGEDMSKLASAGLRPSVCFCGYLCV